MLYHNSHGDTGSNMAWHSLSYFHTVVYFHLKAVHNHHPTRSHSSFLR